MGERKRPAYGKIPGPIRRDSPLLANKKAVWPERAGFESQGGHQCRSPFDRSLLVLSLGPLADKVAGMVRTRTGGISK